MENKQFQPIYAEFQPLWYFLTVSCAGGWFFKSSVATCSCSPFLSSSFDFWHAKKLIPTRGSSGKELLKVYQVFVHCLVFGLVVVLYDLIVEVVNGLTESVK